MPAKGLPEGGELVARPAGTRPRGPPFLPGWQLSPPRIPEGLLHSDTNRSDLPGVTFGNGGIIRAGPLGSGVLVFAAVMVLLTRQGTPDTVHVVSGLAAGVALFLTEEACMVSSAGCRSWIGYLGHPSRSRCHIGAPGSGSETSKAGKT